MPRVHPSAVLLSAAAVAVVAATAQPASCRAAASTSEHVLLQHGGAVLNNPGKHEHPHPSEVVVDYCHTTVEGERCHARLAWVMRYDLAQHPERYEGLSPGASAQEVQEHLYRAGVHFCPPPCSVPSVPSRDGGGDSLEPDEPECGSQFVHMDFFNAQVDLNDAYSAWEQPLPTRFRGLGLVNGRSFDLVVSTPDLGVTGGVGNGGSKFGSVIVRPGVTADVAFSFVDSLTDNPVVLHSFHFSFFDLDGSPSDAFMPTMERFHIDGFEDYVLHEGSEVQVSEAQDGRTTFAGSQFGFGCDNPIDPLSLGLVECFPGFPVDQRKRVVTFRFSRKSGFHATLVSELGGTFRSFLFAGSSSIVTACSMPLPTATLPPTAAPTTQPLLNPEEKATLAPGTDPELAPPLGLCAVFGDPHFITFDGGHTVAFGDWVMWLVKSAEVWVQGWSRGSEGRLGALAIGGDFLEGHTVVLYKDMESQLKVLYDGEPILPEGNSTFDVEGLVEGVRSDVWRADLHNGEILDVRTELQFDSGPWPERFLGNPKGGVVLLRFPQGVEVTATGVNFMSAVITMAPQPGGQGGHCGNFNGDAEDDAEPLGPSFNIPIGPDLDSVPEAQDLFRASGVAGKVGALSDGAHAEAAVAAKEDSPVGKVRALGGTHAQAAVAKDPREVLARCGPELKEQASQRCGRLPNMRLRADCMLDACATGNLAVAEDLLAAEVLEEKVNARGIPVFMGSGQCLDSAGQRYAGFTAEAATAQQCAVWLRRLALTEGVVGAQFGTGPTCHILVDAGKDTQRLLGKAAVAVLGSGGQGLVSATSGARGWKCWQLV